VEPLGLVDGGALVDGAVLVDPEVLGVSVVTGVVSGLTLLLGEDGRLLAGDVVGVKVSLHWQ